MRVFARLRNALRRWLGYAELSELHADLVRQVGEQQRRSTAAIAELQAQIEDLRRIVSQQKTEAERRPRQARRISEVFRVIGRDEDAA